MNISIKNILIFILTVGSYVSIKAQNCLEFYFEESINGNEVTVDLRVNNFEDISTVQLAVAYSSYNLDLNEVSGNMALDILPSQINVQSPGYILFSWSNPTTPQMIADGSSLLQFKFTLIDENIPARIQLDEEYNIEITNGAFNVLCYKATGLVFNDDRAMIVGSVYHDIDEDCGLGISDLPLKEWVVKISGPLSVSYRITDQSGNYTFPAALGEYKIEVVPINDLWIPCVESKTISVDNQGIEYNVSFMISEDGSSPAPVVSISAQSALRCNNNEYRVRYKNDGTSTSTNTRIEILFDDNLNYVSDDFGDLVINGDLASANVGVLKPGEEGEFSIVMNIGCDDLDLGQTICAVAEITSDNISNPPSAWDGAVLTTNVSCVEDSVEVTIKNIGNLPVVAPLNFIVVEDDVMFNTNTIELEAEEDLVLRFPDNGGVYRVVADQELGYPYGSYTTDFIQSCDGDNLGSFDFVSMFPNEDSYPLLDIECLALEEETEQNVKTAYPVGYREDHNIEQNQDIEYTIKFQNTTGDTAYHLYIEDYVDLSMDISSIIPGPSSHPYTISISEDRTLRFDFFNIQLLDYSINEDASHGFVSYSIAQNLDLPLGTIIGNEAQIIFGQGDTIVTNVVNHQIGDEFIDIMLNNENIILDDQLVASPNPASDVMRIEIPQEFDNISYVLYSMNGIVANAANASSNVFYINRHMMISGMYILEVRSDDKPIGTKKILFKDSF